MEEEGSTAKLTYKEKLKFANPISKPMAPKSLTKKLYKLIKNAGEQKHLRVGLKDVQKYLRRGEHGLVVLGADVTPVDIICHIPAVCEEKNIPYCYTPSRDDIGHAAGLRRTAVMVLVQKDAAYKELYETCEQLIGELPVSE